MNRIISPGSSIGIFGGGQLGRMLTHAAQRLGYRVVVFTDEIDSPASQVANETVHADYLDPDAVRTFAKKVDVITLEFENIALEAVSRAAEVTLVRPSVHLLSIAQHRIKEKRTLRDFGFPVTPFREVRSIQDITPTALELGWPLVLKTTNWGYDGKGQRRVANQIEANDAMELLGPEPLIAEKWIPYQVEVSVIVARTPNGATAVYPMFTNSHHNHILDITTCPAAPELGKVAREAESIAFGVAESLQLEGLLCVEFFVTHQGEVMINEMAPRPHNSGHLTIDACRTSQFEQQVRAICNLPLGDTSLIQPAAMANLLGDVWGSQTPHFEKALAQPLTYLHLYGKQTARSGRKMGHITQLANSAAEASAGVAAIRESIRNSE
ncbi:MAG: 5-(carboxyamino)imidazole ribonucleotide synthase, partial [Pirellula sp.]